MTVMNSYWNILATEIVDLPIKKKSDFHCLIARYGMWNTIHFTWKNQYNWWCSFSNGFSSALCKKLPEGCPWWRMPDKKRCPNNVGISAEFHGYPRKTMKDQYDQLRWFNIRFWTNLEINMISNAVIFTSSRHQMIGPTPFVRNNKWGENMQKHWPSEQKNCGMAPAILFTLVSRWYYISTVGCSQATFF